MKTEQQKEAMHRALRVLKEISEEEIAIARKNAERRWVSIANGDEPYWFWNAFVQSSATNGGAGHLDRLIFIRKEFESACGIDPLEWETVTQYDNELLSQWVGVAANPHYQRWEQIRGRLKDFVTTNRCNLVEVSLRLQGSDRAACIKLLKAIPGISDKYARNLMMDVGHPEFMDGSFALDSRILGFLEATTGLGHTYSQTSKTKWTENELVAIAHEAGHTAWEVDRLIFGFWSQLNGKRKDTAVSVP
ncbi:hypothetical protein [Neorhizobium sp. DAR64872/K0K18]|uniref:hypothetical protein n=1 Tax=Neorhizobium sp. DAR64872/K0K18 TaxID=3421958 RepID=UPI003D2CCCB5